jgi:hypothetical protein
MNRLLIFLAVVFYSQLSFAQFNDSTNHHFSFATTGIINKTKETSSFVLNNAAGFSINKKKISQNTAVSWIYGKQQQKLSNNDLSVNADFDYLKNIQKLYYWALANFDESYSLKINYRFQTGLGIGYTVFKNPDLNLVLSDGFVYETSDLTDPIVGKDIYQTVRNSFRIKYHWAIKEILILDGSHFIQPSLISLKDYILKSNSTLTIKLNKWLGINASLGYNKISRTNRENLLMTYGLTVDRYF